MNNIPIAIMRAAEARANGLSYAAAAKAATWSLEDLHRWIRKHEWEWYRVLHRARRDARDLACDEAVALLRQQLRDDEKKTIFNAADALAKRFATPKGRPPYDRLCAICRHAR